MRWLFILLLLWPWHGQAQRKTVRTPAKWPIKSLNVEGNQHYSKDQIIAATGLAVGQPAGKEDFDAARERLMATGVFENVGYQYKPAADGSGYAVSFQVTEVEPLYPMRVEGLDISIADLQAWLKRKNPFLGEKMPATAEMLDRTSKMIEEYLAAKNRKEKVLANVVADTPEQPAIVFRPARGEPVIAEVKFVGNEVVPSQALQTAIAGVAVGTPFSEAGFRQILDNAVRPLYEARGRIRVAFPYIKTEKAKTVEGLLVTVTVDEGPSFDLGDVQVTGNSAISSKNLLKAGNFKTGDIANFDEVAAGVERIKKLYRHNGYMKADARVERKIHDKPKTVDVLLHIEEGPQYTFAKLSIQGLDINGEAAVRRLWALKEGKPYNADYPDYFLNRIREDQVFENLGKTRSVADLNDQTHVVNVTLYFGAPEKPPRL